MPALTNFSKEFIIEHLTKIIHDIEDRNSELQAELDLLHRKIAHGCTDCSCKECDP